MSLARELARRENSLRVEDVNLIQDLCRILHPDVVIDIGAGIGNSALAVLEMNIPVATVEHSQHYIEEAEKNVPTEMWPLWRRVLADSVEAASQWEDETLDLVLLDTTHYYLRTVREIAAWMPKLRTGGILWCHDYLDVSQQGYGVKKRLDELIEMGKVRLISQAGLGCAVQKP